jgi:cardiolipin synthase
MRRALTRARIWQSCRVLRRWLGRCVLGILTGCRAPAQPYFVDSGDMVQPRGVVIVRQVMEDSAIEFANRPLAGGWECLVDGTEHFMAWIEGGVAKRLVMPLWGDPIPLQPASEPLDSGTLDEALRMLTGQTAQPAHLQFQFDGDEAYRTLQRLIGQATSRIDIIMFSWDGDDLGEALAAQLAQRAGPELRVRILVDGGGNLFFGEPDEANASSVNRVLATLARHPHIEVVRIRNPFGRFDHRKLVLVDGRWAWSGGRNFSRSSFFAFHDVSFVLTGPLVERLQERFEQDWQVQTGASTFVSRNPAAEPTARRASDLPAIQIQWATGTGARTNNALARVLHSEPGNRQISQALYHAVDQARQHVYLENVYFSDSRLIYKLAQARRRGVDVRVIMTFQSTTPLHNRANRVLANRLLRAGVRVYVYPGMTHVKAVSVDGVWAYLGTGNFDPLSMRHNYEVGLSIHAGPVIAELEQRLFRTDFRPEWELTAPVPVSIQDHLAEWVASLWL